jgi:hypothetical protein
LRAIISDGGICGFSFASKNGFIAAPKQFQAKAGIWMGAKVGIYALKRDLKKSAGHADFKYFYFRPKPPAD